MPKAEVGSTKYLNNKLKSKGLQRLRWFCQVCEKQCRDENGFKCHVQSESHVRQMAVVGENANKYISDYSHQFQRDFLQLLRTSHNTKAVLINHFYQQYIANKEHVHMNATRWPSLTEFAKYLGREGICRVEDTDKGLQIAWIDNSPEALRRQAEIRKKERQDKGDEEREQKMILEQIDRAAMARETKLDNIQDRELMRGGVEKIKLSFGTKVKEDNEHQPPAVAESGDAKDPGQRERESAASTSPPAGVPTPPPEKVSLKTSANNKPKNVFAIPSKKNALGSKRMSKQVSKKPMTEAERIMKEEIERKRIREANGGAPGLKRPRIA